MITKQDYNKQNRLERLGMSQMKGRKLFFTKDSNHRWPNGTSIHPEYPWAPTFNYMGFSHNNNRFVKSS